MKKVWMEIKKRQANLYEYNYVAMPIEIPSIQR